MSKSALPEAAPSRQALRKELLAARERFVATEQAPSAAATLTHFLVDVLVQLEPGILGLYWPVRAEFNAPAGILAEAALAQWPLALPFARRAGHEMAYRLWDRTRPTLTDECGIATASGEATVPDVVLVPCLGFTDEGFRLGYGGGYFDRWLARHPHVSAVGVAWWVGRLDAAKFQPEAHDRALTLIVTERGVV
jgi:5,10-methenyltetrahydrofolate synthetase